MSSPSTNGVPLCDVQAQYQKLKPELEAAVLRSLESGQVILGPEVASLEEEVAAYCKTRHAVGCSSGSDALLLALKALDVGPGDEVILPPFTFFATVGAVCRAGARPVFADIEQSSYNVDCKKIQEQITHRTRAILVVHLFGQCAEMKPLQEVANRENLLLIEDAAQAIGAEYHGARAGSMGSMGCFSFYPSKNLGAYGDAGIVTTNNPEWAQRLSCLRGHGMEPKYYHKYLGWNARLDAVQAALLRVKLPHLDQWISLRQQAAQRYHELIKARDLTSVLSPPETLPHRRHVFNQYVVRVAPEQRNGLMKHLHQEKIGCDIYYPVPLHLQDCLRDLGYKKGDFPVSEVACDSVLALPLFPEITPEQQEQVIQSCARFFEQSGSREEVKAA